MIQTFAELLTKEQVENVHEASLEILERVGLLVRNEQAREIFARHGASVDPKSEVVRIARPIAEEYRKLFPPKFAFYARDPRYDRTLPDDSPLILTGSSAPNIIDPVTGYDRAGCELPHWRCISDLDVRRELTSNR